MPVTIPVTLPDELAEPYIRAKAGFLKTMLTRGCLTGPAVADTYNPLLLYIMRNTLCKLDGFRDIARAEIYIAGKDNRCYARV